MNKIDNRYYLKWDVENKSFLLDTQFVKNGFAYAIRNIKVTQEQAGQYAQRIEDRYLNRKKYIDVNVLEFEFDYFFKICRKCKTPTSKIVWARRQKDLCFDCYQEELTDRRKEGFKAYWEKHRILRLQSYAKTEQGIADSVGVSAIKANIKIQLAKHGKKQSDLAVMLGVGDSSVTQILNGNKSIKIEYLYKIAEWLFVPIDLLLKTPRGMRPLKRKNKIPINIYRKPMRTVRIEKYQLD